RRAVGDRLLEALRPGVHRLRREGRPGELDADGGALPLPDVGRRHAARLRRRGRRRPLPDHLLLYARAAASLRARGDRLLMAVEPEAPHIAAIEQLAHGEQPAAATTTVPGRGPGFYAARVVLYVILVAVAVFYLWPFFWTISTSLKTVPESVQTTVI